MTVLFEILFVTFFSLLMSPESQASDMKMEVKKVEKVIDEKCPSREKKEIKRAAKYLAALSQ